MNDITSMHVGAVVVVIVCNQVPITTNVAISNPDLALDATFGEKVCHRLAACRWFSPGTPVSSTSKTDTISLKYCYKWR